MSTSGGSFSKDTIWAILTLNASVLLMTTGMIVTSAVRVSKVLKANLRGSHML